MRGRDRRRVEILGCPVDTIDKSETMARIEEYVRKHTRCQHVVVNASKLVSMDRDPELRRIVSECDLINADGMSVVWASKLLGNPLPERVTGVDLFQCLIRLCNEKGYRPYFFGARDWVVEKVAATFHEKYPRLDIAGYRNGYFSEEDEPDIAEQIKSSKADMLFVGFSSPMKEKFLKKWMPVMRVPFCMGVGGSFDIVAGKTKRAPLWMQNTGLEWLYRLIQEPRRMWKRYAITNTVFVWLLLRELIRQNGSGITKKNASV